MDRSLRVMCSIVSTTTRDNNTGHPSFHAAPLNSPKTLKPSIHNSNIGR